jgi:thioredoxin 1
MGRREACITIASPATGAMTIRARPGHKEEMEMSQPMAITDAQFDQEVLKSSLPVVVDFWAPWCGPCRIVGPVIEKLSRELEGQVRFVKINVDENPLQAGAFGVQGIPTLIFFKDGEAVNRVVGAMPEPALKAQIQSAFGNGVSA